MKSASAVLCCARSALEEFVDWRNEKEKKYRRLNTNWITHVNSGMECGLVFQKLEDIFCKSAQRALGFAAWVGLLALPAYRAPA